MPLWNTNDRENSKPEWLTEEQKRLCFRTVRGWEIPLAGCGYTGSTSNYFSGTGNATNSRSFVVPTELIVCMPFDTSATGVVPDSYTARGTTASIPGYTASDETNNKNYAPYFTTPFANDHIRVPWGTTSYIPVIVADSNPTEFGNQFTITFASGGNPTASHISFQYPLTTGLTTSIGGQFWFPTGLTNSTYPNGGWGGVTFAASALRIASSLTSGTYGCTGEVWDNRTSFPLTGNVFFRVQVL